MWGSIGDKPLEEFLLGANYGYLRDKLQYNLGFMGMKKEAHKKLDEFMIRCWPKLRDVIEREYDK